MSVNILIILSLISLMATIIITGVLRRIAINFNMLIDIPNKSRKFHSRPTPLTGGIGIISGILIGIASFLLLGNYIYFSNQNDFTYQTSIEIKENDSLEVFDINLNLDSSDNAFNDVQIDGGNIESPNFKVIDLGNGVFEVKFLDGKSQRFLISDQKITAVETGESFEYIDRSKSDLLKIDIFLKGLAFACLALLALTIIDDLFRYGISPIIRFALQITICLALIVYSNTSIRELGFSFLGWEGNLGLLSVPFTLFAVTGITNAFNMVDGINGLCGSLAISCFGVLLFFTFPIAFGYIFIIIISAILGFLMYNLGFFGRKRRVFLGDNGSIFLGFLSAWFCVYFSSPTIGLIKPVTALWLVAIPLIDCVSVILYRLSIGKLPLNPDRNHLHHLIYDKLGRTSYKSNREFLTLLIIFTLSLLLGLIGVGFEQYSVSMEISLITIMSIGITYHLLLRRKLN